MIKQEIKQEIINRLEKNGQDVELQLGDNVKIKASTTYGILDMLSMQTKTPRLNGHSYDE